MKQFIEKWAENTKQSFIDYYQSSGIKASGNWANELDYQIEISDFNIKVRFLGASYTEQLVNGRRPNQKSSKEDLKAWVGWAGSTFLKEWVNQKGIPANPFAVAWKIAREGWKIPNAYNKGDLVSNVLTLDKAKELAQIIGNSIVDDIKLKIIGNGN